MTNLISSDKLKAEKCKRSFYYFVTTFFHVVIQEEPVFNWHIKYLCDILQAIIERVEKRLPKLYDLIINIPPGSSKSTIVTQMLPVWCWLRDPSIRAMTASYSSTLSTDHSVKSRDIIKSDLFRLYFPEIQIKSDQDNKAHYKNTKGGERLATSVTGTATGFHAHVIIVDDPLNPREAVSEVSRVTANSFMDTTLSTRKVDKKLTPTILVMQRLHQSDPTGNWLSKKEKRIKHICLPGELSKHVNPPELKANYINGLLDPVRLSREDLKDLSIDLGSYGYAGQIGQTPAPETGGIWKNWFVPIPHEQIPRLLEDHGSDWDLAYTEKEKNSASAYCSAGKHENKMYITDIGFAWLEFPKLIPYMKTKPFPHYIEGKASGKSAKQVLTNQGIPAIEVDVVGGDKVARARMATPYAESGVIYILDSLHDKLLHAEKQGILLFPNNDNDDLQDAVVQSINRLLGRKPFFVL
jgi:predicted phage terminase large subunit-like protein